MKQLYVLHWLAAVVLVAPLAVTTRAMSGQGMGGFAGGGPRGFMGGGPRGFMGGGPRGFMGGGPRGFMGGGPHGFMRGGPHGFVGGGPRGSMGPRFGGFGFRHDDRFFDRHRFADHNRFFDHRFVNHDRFFDHRFVDRDRFFFHHQNRFFFSFDFVSFGFPWWYPWYPSYPAYYPYYPYYPPYSSYYGYPYDSSYSGSGQAFDYQYWTNLAVSVQSELAQRGYYQGRIDGLIGSESRQAIRAFQAAQGLPVSGVIDPKLLNALGINYRSA